MTEKPKTWKKVLKYTYWVIIHCFAVLAAFLLITALAVKMKWTNNAGSVDDNNRYFGDMAQQYGKELKKDSSIVLQDDNLFFRKLGILAAYYPQNAKIILEAYHKSSDAMVGLRMIDAANIMLKGNKQYQKDMMAIKPLIKPESKSLYAWSNYGVWKAFCKTVAKDRRAIDSVSRITGVESRIIVMCLVGEQIRMFNSGREKFKQTVMPYSRLIMPTNRGYGVTGILEHTAVRIERQLFDKKNKFYAGDYFQQCVNVNDSFPRVVNDSIPSHKRKTIQRLIKGGDHYYSYLYTAFLMRQYQAHWEANGFDLSRRPEILGTLFNIGFEKSKPKTNPDVGGSTFNIGGKDYTFGGLCFEFYYSGELQEYFPITSRGFIPVKELEIKNKSYFESIQKKLEKEKLAQKAAKESK